MILVTRRGVTGFNISTQGVKSTCNPMLESVSNGFLPKKKHFSFIPCRGLKIDLTLGHRYQSSEKYISWIPVRIRHGSSQWDGTHWKVTCSPLSVSSLIAAQISQPKGVVCVAGPPRSVASADWESVQITGSLSRSLRWSPQKALYWLYEKWELIYVQGAAVASVQTRISAYFPPMILVAMNWVMSATNRRI